MWADDVTQMPEKSSSDDLADESYSQLNQEEQLWYNILLEFNETLVNFGLAVFPKSNGAEGGQEIWNVQIWHTSQASTFLVYAPAPSADTQGELHLGVPKALWSDAYDWMSRLWLLHKGTSGSQYCVCGKSRLAGFSTLPDSPGVRVTIVGEGQ